MNARAMACLLSAALLGGCASKDVVMLSEGTLVLAEVARLLTDQPQGDGLWAADNELEKIRGWILDFGFTDQQIDRGRVILVRERIYWNNTLSGIKREKLRPALLPAGLQVEPGNIIEGIVGIPYRVVRVRASSLDAGKCRYDELPTGLARGLMGAVSMTGPSGSATLYCEGIENEGWVRPRSFWHKPPQAQPDAQ